MEGLMTLLLLVAGVLILVGYGRYQQEGDKGLLQMAMMPFVLTFWILGFLVKGAGKQLPAIFGPRSVRNPESAELVSRRVANPAAPPREVAHKKWRIFGKTYDAVHFVLVGEPGSAKGQTAVNYVIRDQLVAGSEHLVILDVKGELEEIVQRYSRPSDRVFVYSTHATDGGSSALNLFTDPDRAGEIAQSLTQPERSNDPYWGEKAADLIEAVAVAVGGSLLKTRDVIANGLKLDDLRDENEDVDNVADNEKEWGYIRSNATRALVALKMLRVRRMFAARTTTEQPDFSRHDRRAIVVLKPSEEIAERLSPIMSAAIDALYASAASGGWQGGPGTKFVIDEAASYMALNKLPSYLEIGRGRKVQLMYVLQSVVQLRDVLKGDRADRVLASTELQAVGATTDFQTAEWFEKLSGQQRVFYKGPKDAEGTRQQAEHFRPRVQAHEIVAQGPGEWTLRQHAKIEKVRVPESRYYYRQQHPEPKRIKVRGVAKKEDYAERQA